MNILIIGPAHPYRGGIADTNESWCRAFNKIGHRCRIITFRLQYPSFLFPGKTQLTTDPAPSNIEITRDINSISPFNWIKISKKINKENPDLVIFRFWIPFIGMCFSQIAKRLNSKIKKIALCDNVLPHESRLGDKYLTQKFINQMDGFITMSSKVATELQRFTPHPSVIIPHPINDQLGTLVAKNIAKQKLNLDREYQYILFFGLVRKYKGLDLLLKAMEATALKSLKVKLLIAGEFYDHKEKYLNLIDTLAIRNRVVIIDQFIPADDIKYYFCASDLVAQTYHSASQSGITPMAIHFEKSMLVTDVGGLSEGIDHLKNGLVSTTDPERIAHNLSEFFSYDLANTFETNLRQLKSEMTWENFSLQVIKFVAGL